MSSIRIAIASATVGALVSTAATALAGSGVGGVFNLGQTNTVDAATSVSGTVGGNGQLDALNGSTAAASFGTLGKMTSLSASAGSSGVRGVNNGAGRGVYGSSTAGVGVLGTHDGSGGTAAGVEGSSSSTGSGALGVLGEVSSSLGDSAGVKGVNSGGDAGGYGVWGLHQGSGIGVYGSSDAGYGVYGVHNNETGTPAGVTGESYSGVVGASAVRGISHSKASSGYGVYGSQDASGPGVYGVSNIGVGVRGTTSGNSANPAVEGQNPGFGPGVKGTSASAEGVYGFSAKGHGVLGISNFGRGVWGKSQTFARSSSGNNPGVYGEGNGEDGVWAISQQATGIYAQAPNYAAYLNGRVFVDRSLSLGWRTLPSGGAPDVRNGSLYRVSNGSGTLITDLVNGRSGQQLTLRFTNSNTDVADGGSLRLAGAFAPSADDTLQLVNDNGIWYETGRSSN